MRDEPLTRPGLKSAGGWLAASMVATLLLVGWSAPTAGAQAVPSVVTPVSAPTATSQVTVVHGLRGQLVDVTLDGTRLLESFQPDRLTDPMTLSAGRHRLELRPSGSDPAAAPKVATDLDLPGGQDLSIVAHFAPDGQWATTLYRNDVSALTGGAGAIVFRNDAAITPVDVSVDGTKVVGALANPGESVQPVGTGARSIGVNATGTPQVLVPANDVTVTAGSATYLYLVGTGTGVTWLSQRIDATRVSPARIVTGNSGLADPDRQASVDRSSLLVLLLCVAVAVGLVAAPSVRRARP